MPASKQISDEQITEVVKHRRPKRSEDLQPHYEPGEMSAMIADAINISSFGKVDINDPQAVEERLNQYLQYCMQRDMKPSVESMALAFGTNRMQLWRWVNGVECNIPEESRYAIKKGYNIMNQLLAQTMMDGKINPVSAIFLMKNNMGYRDQTEVVVTPNNPLNDLNDTQATKRILDAIPVEDDD